MKKIKNITFIYAIFLITLVNLDIFSIIQVLLQYLVLYLFYVNLILIEKFDNTIKDYYCKKNLLLSSAIAFLFLVHDFLIYTNIISSKNSLSYCATFLFIFSLVYLLVFKIPETKNSKAINEKLKEVSIALNETALLDDSSNKLEAIIDEKSKIKDSKVVSLKTEKSIKQNEFGIFNILIVDDDLITIKILTNYLSSENYSVTKALDGESALKLLDNGLKPDIIILDIMMPKMSGYEVCSKIREKYPLYALPIVLLTGKNEISDLVTGFDLGANDFLTKPVSKRELIARIKTHIELAKINYSYGKFVPREFLRFLGRDSIIDVKLGDQIQLNMSVMFSDIRSFTSLSEKMTPEENFNFLNSYLSRVSPVIRKNGGFIDKYIGDGMMALFPKEPENAIDSALEMLFQLKILNDERAKKNFEKISIGIGIHTGSLILGTIGEEERMESTVISDAVNLSARMEDLTKVYSASIIISEQTLNELKDKEKYKYRFLGKVQVKGKKKYVSIFEIYDIYDTELLELRNKTENYFNAAIKAYYNREFTKSIQLFEKVLEINPKDKIAYFYTDKMEELARIGISENGTGLDKVDIE